MNPPITCVLINYRFPEDTLACLLSLRESGKDAFKVFLINNYPADGSGKALKAFLDGSGMAWPWSFFPLLS